MCNAVLCGPDIEIEEECVGQVQKRVGANLRKLKKDYAGKKLSDGLSLGGRGRLTDNLIKDLQSYYGMAVRRHSNDVPAMARANWASLIHSTSTDAKPQHQYCPSAPDTWCH